MIRHNIRNSHQYHDKQWAALCQAYPLCTAYIQSVFPADAENMPWSAADGDGHSWKIVDYCRRFGFAFRTFGHCDNVSTVVYTGEPAYITTQMDEYAVLNIIFHRLEPVLAQLVSQGLPPIPPERKLSPLLELFTNQEESTTLEFQSFAEGISVPALKQQMEQAGIPFLDYIFDRTLVWKRDLERIEDELKNKKC